MSGIAIAIFTIKGARMNFIEIIKSALNNAKDKHFDKIRRPEKQADESLLQRDALLGAIAQSALKLLESPDSWEMAQRSISF